MNSGRDKSMKINDITNKIDASYNTIKKFIEKNEDYYENKNNVLHVTKIGLAALESKYGVRSEVMSDTDVDFYKAQLRFMGNQLEELKQYNQTFQNMIEMKDQETELKLLEIKEKEESIKEKDDVIKELEKKLHQQELDKQEIIHKLELEKNKSLFKKIFRKK